MVRRDRLTASCAAWILSAVAVIMLQVRSWWGYQWVLLICPLSILSALSLEAAVQTLKTCARRWVAIVLFSVVLVPFVRKVIAINVKDRETHFAQLVLVNREVQFLKQSLSGRVLVVQNPEIYYRSRRRPATTVHTYPLMWSSSQMQRLCSEIRRSQPVLTLLPNWLKLDEYPSDCLLRFLEDHREVRRSELGVWYVKPRRPAAEKQPGP